MSISEVKERSLQQLGGGLSSSCWWIAVVVCLIQSVLISTAASVTSFVAGIGGIIITGPLTYGLYAMFLKQTRDGQDMNVADVFAAFNTDFLQTFLIGLFITLFTAIGSALCVVPGIIVSYMYAMAYYVKMDHPEMDYRQCLAESRRIMNGRKMDLFILDLSFIGWLILGVLCCGVGVLVVVPWMNAAHAHYYESIRNA